MSMTPQLEAISDQKLKPISEESISFLNGYSDWNLEGHTLQTQVTNMPTQMELADLSSIIPDTLTEVKDDESDYFNTTSHSHPRAYEPRRSVVELEYILATSLGFGDSDGGPATVTEETEVSQSVPVATPDISVGINNEMVSECTLSSSERMISPDSLPARSLSGSSLGVRTSSPCGSPSARRRRNKETRSNSNQNEAKNHACSLCPARFVCRSKLDRHMRIHTGDKPFGCFCGARFNQKSALKNHTRRHLKKETTPAGVDVTINGLNGFSYTSLVQGMQTISN